MRILLSLFKIGDTIGERLLVRVLDLQGYPAMHPSDLFLSQLAHERQSGFVCLIQLELRCLRDSRDLVVVWGKPCAFYGPKLWQVHVSSEL
eukprot:5360617-Amphidinium_carterae.2